MERIKKHKKITSRELQIFLLLLPSVVCLFIFSYLPMFGVVLAFKDGNYSLNVLDSLSRSDWTFDNFKLLFRNETFWQVFFNTIKINGLLLLLNFPMPIIFALLLNEIKGKHAKNAFLTVSTLPHFLSWTVFGGIIIMLTDMNIGIINPILEFLGLSSRENPVDLNLPQYFYAKMIIASILKGAGWGSIIYSAAICGIDQRLYEAAEIDGANGFQKAIHVTLPCIRSTIITYLLLNVAHILNNSFEQFYVFQNPANLETTRVLSTYMYNLGFTYREYSTATALSLVEGVLSLVLIVSSNKISKKLTGEGILY